MLSVQIYLGLLAAFVMFPPTESVNSWTIIPATRETQPYEVWVKTLFNQGHHINCGGVILNDRYVLTIYRCTISVFKTIISTSKNIRIQVNYVSSLIPKHRKNKTETEYEIEEVWPSDYDEHFGPLYFFALLRTKLPIQFNANVKCINLPVGVLAWKNPSTMPNNEEVQSSYWCREGKNYQVFIKKGILNCSDSIRLRTPRWLIPSCLENTSNIKCYWPYGSPLFHKDTLIGIRNYEGRSPSPYPEANYDLFLNVAQYTHLLMDHMRDYIPCKSMREKQDLKKDLHASYLNSDELISSIGFKELEKF